MPKKPKPVPAPVKKKTWARGKPAHVPTDISRAQVSAYQICGVPHHELAELIGITTKTLLKYYSAELKAAKHKANAIVNQRLFAQTKTSAAAAIFWHKAQMGWRETQVIAGDRENPLAFATVEKEVREVSKEEAEQAYLKLLSE